MSHSESIAAIPEPVPVTSHDTVGSMHLDALRGAAALLVFVNHTRALYFTSALGSKPMQGVHSGAFGRWAVFDGEIKFATEAVVVFFVLSGYLVGGSVIKSLRHGRWSWRSYLVKRLSRLYVVLIPAILLTVALDHLGLYLADAGSVYWNPPGIALGTTLDLVQRLQWPVVLGNLFFLQGILVSEVGTDVALWSLANEFWYYLIFPMIAICFFARYRWYIRSGYILASVGLLYFITLWLDAQFPIWIAGALLVMIPQGLTEKSARIGSLVSFVLLLVTMIAVRLLHLRAINADYLIAIATCIFLYCVVQLRRPAAASLYKRVSRFFSNISYSLYLFHLPISVFLCGRLNTPWHSWNRSLSNLLMFFAADLFVLAVVWMLWRVLEANTDAVRQRLFGH